MMPQPNRLSFLNRWPVTIRPASALGASLLAAMAGCSSGPSRVTPPSISASGAASEAMTTYDKDSDGFIAGAELDAAPALKAAMATLDVDKDGKVSEDEIAQRIEAWQNNGAGLTMIACQVTMDGKPLSGATVTFVPAPFLADALETAIGVTTDSGMAEPSIPKAERPNPDWPPGIQFGFFDVKISKKVNGNESIAAKYNEATTLGHQVSPDDPALLSQKMTFPLKSK